MTLFNEKPQMPVTGVINCTPAGEWVFDDKKIQYAHDSPLVREVECDVVMSVPAAVAVRNMLTNFIDSAVKHMQEASRVAAELGKQPK
jgi:hypothetical protein